MIARTDAEAADLITSDYDENDKPFLTGERTAEGFYKTRKGIDQAISRAVAYAHYADLVWCETGTPDLAFAKKFADAVHKVHPGKMLAYNCSPSFNWKKNLDDATIAKFQKELGAMGYKYQFITLAGIHSMWFNMFDLAQDYVKRGMSAYVEKVQEPEFAARDRGYTFVSHQQEVGTGYFDEVTTVIQGGKSSVTALTGFDRRRAVPLSIRCRRCFAKPGRARRAFCLRAAKLARPATHKSEKGILVMTPRTTPQGSFFGPRYRPVALVRAGLNQLSKP